MAISFIGAAGASAAAINGASVTLTFTTAPSAGDIVVVWNVTTTTSQPAQTVVSGSGAAYTSLVSTANGNLRVRAWYRVCGAGETTCTCSGSGAATDATAAAAFVFRGATPYTPVGISSLGTGTSSQPKSPPDTADHTGDAVISMVASLANSVAAVTAPTSFLNLISTGATDTRSCQLGMSWITSTNVSAPLLYTPTAYSSFTSAAWIGFTVTIQSSDPNNPFDMANRSGLDIPSGYLVKEGMIGY